LIALPLLVGCARIAKPSGWVSPEIIDDTVFASLDGGEISAVQLDTLTEIWTFPADDETRCPDRDEKLDLKGIYGAPAVSDEAVYLGAYDDYVYALSRDDGECLWSFQTGDPVIAGPILDGTRLLAASTDGYLYVLDPETGEEIDRKETGSVAATPLLTEDGEVYISTEGGQLWKIDADSLEPIWNPPFEVNTGLLTPPVLTESEAVVVGGIGARLFGVDAGSAEQRWSFGARNWFWGKPAIYGEGESEIIVATNLDGKVYGLDPLTGEEAWPPIDSGDPIRGGAAVSDSGTAVAVSNQGLVLLINAATGELLDEVDLKEGVYASPVVHDGAALIISRSHDMFRVDLETGRVEEVSTQ
jgi:outer membrane protein assembly factor BamB